MKATNRQTVRKVEAAACRFGSGSGKRQAAASTFAYAKAIISLFWLAFAPAADASEASAPSRIRSLDAAASDGRVHLLYAVGPSAEESRVFHIVSADGGESWTAPVRVDGEGRPAPYARGRGTDFQIAASGENLVAVWLARGSGFGGRGPQAAAISKDGGANWRPVDAPPDDASDRDQAFVDLAAGPDGRFHAVWLDTRLGEGKSLMTASSAVGGASWESDRVADAEVCECCWNTLKADAEGWLYALYRDIQPRDMGLVLSRDGGETWERLPAVGSFGWDFQGCPHVGGALAIEGAGEDARLRALVWTGKDGAAGLHYLSASSPGAAWSEPRRVGGPRAVHGDLAIAADGRIAVAYDEEGPDGARLSYGVSSDSGRTWRLGRVPVDPERRPTHPRLVELDGAFHLFWTEGDGRAAGHYRFGDAGDQASADAVSTPVEVKPAGPASSE